MSRHAAVSWAVRHPAERLRRPSGSCHHDTLELTGLTGRRPGRGPGDQVAWWSPTSRRGWSRSGRVAAPDRRRRSTIRYDPPAARRAGARRRVHPAGLRRAGAGRSLASTGRSPHSSRRPSGRWPTGSVRPPTGAPGWSASPCRSRRDAGRGGAAVLDLRAASSARASCPPSSRRPATSWRCRRSCSASRPTWTPKRTTVEPTPLRDGTIPAGGQRPSKTGFSLATKAAVALRWSAVRAADRLRLRLGGQRVGQRAGVADGQLPLDRAVRDGRPGGEPGGQLLRGRQHLLVVVDQPGEQAEPAAPRRPDRLGEHQQLDAPWRGRRAGAASRRRRCRRPGRRWRTPSGTWSPARRCGSRPAAPATRRRRRPCRAPRRPPAWAGWPAAARSGCSAPRRCPAGRCAAAPASPRARAGPARRRTPGRRRRAPPPGRTGRSPATPSVSRSASLSATSSAFIASGRLRVRVTTPSARSTSSASVMVSGSFTVGRRRARCEAAVDVAVGGRAQPGRVPVEERGRARCRASASGSSAGGQLRVAEQERPPGVHQPEPGRVRLLVVAAGGDRGDAAGVCSATNSLVRRGRARPGPRPGGPAPRRRRAGRVAGA